MIVLTLLALSISADPACTPQRPMTQVVTRASKYDSTSARVGEAMVKICYGRPLVNGRKVFGGTLVPFGTLWRTGANEPTIIHTTAPITVAGVRLAAGSYSLYTVPQEKGDWEIVLNRSISQWGHEGSYAGVKDQELPRGSAQSSALAEAVEAFTITASATALTLSWEKTKVTIPVSAAK